MEKPIGLPVDNIYKDAAQSFVFSEIEKIEMIRSQNFPDFIKDHCSKIRSFLEEGIAGVLDKYDLMEFKGQLRFVAELLDLFLSSSPSKSSWWAMALIKECYEKCDIDHTTRDILIIHYLNSRDYSVVPDLLSFAPSAELKNNSRPIDVFVIPSEARHDVSSIALLGHEVGHIYWKQNYKSIADVINDKFREGYETNLTLFNFDELKVKRERISSHIEEFLCDEIGRYLLGPAFDFALLKLFIASQDNFVGSHTHPAEKSRIEKSLRSLQGFQCALPEPKACLKTMSDYFSGIEIFSPTLPFVDPDDNFAEELARRIHATSLFKEFDSNQISDNWTMVVPELDAFRPPFEKVGVEKPQIIKPTAAVLITCLYFYGKQYQTSNEYFELKDDTPNKDELIRTKLVSHLCYAIGLHDFVKRAHEKYCGDSFRKEDVESTLWQMRERKVAGRSHPFVITPSISPKSQYSSTSVDLRLGNSFLINRTTGYTHISPNPSTITDKEPTPLDAFYDELFIPVGKRFILHPHQFVLAATLEYISIPEDFYALVLGRSSWGRLGLTIATATTVHSGYRGCVTLELRNLGETPLPIEVGLRIAQLCLIPVPLDESSKGYFASTGKYIGPVGPEVPKINSDSDWELLNTLD
jgi:dCTP deaminase